MVRVAVIKPGNLSMSDLAEVISPLLYKALIKEGRRVHKTRIEEKISEILQPYVRMEEIGGEDVLSQMVQLIQPPSEEDLRFNCEASYGYSRGFTEVLYRMEQSEETPVNAIGCYHSLSHTVIRGDCLVVANRFVVNSNGSVAVVRGDLEMQDLVRVIRRRFYRSAMLVDGEMMAKYYYQSSQHLIESIFGGGTESASSPSAKARQEGLQIKTEELSFLNHSLSLRHREESQGVVNKIASRLLGKKLVGPVIFQLHLEKPNDLTDDISDNLTERCLKRINLLAYGSLSERNVGKNDLPAEYLQDNDNHWCRYYYLESRMSALKRNPRRCAGCRGELGTKQFTCPVTYRYKYCSEQCVRAGQA